MPSSVDPVYICNLALSRMSARSQITALTDNSREAKLCNLHYEQARDECLEEGDFSWSRRRAALASATLTTYPNGVNVTSSVKGPWKYGYRLPSDVLTPIAISTNLQITPADARIPYSIEVLDGVEVLYTDVDTADAILIYIARVTDTSLFSRKFASVVAWKLAAEIASPLTGKAALAKEMKITARLSMDDAIAHDYRREQEPEPPDPDWIRVRGSALAYPYLNTDE